MAENKRVTLHPLKSDGTLDLDVNLYPKTLLDGVVDREGNEVDVVTKNDLQIIDIDSGITEEIKQKVINNPSSLLRYGGEYVYTPYYKNDSSLPDWYVCFAGDEHIVYYLNIDWDELLLYPSSNSILTTDSPQEIDSYKVIDCNNGPKFGVHDDTKAQLIFENRAIRGLGTAYMGIYEGRIEEQANSFRIAYKHPTSAENYCLDIGNKGITFDYFDDFDGEWNNLIHIDNDRILLGSITVADIENKQNKVTSISAQSTDTQYPSAKCVYDNLLKKLNSLDGVENVGYLHTSDSCYDFYNQILNGATFSQLSDPKYFVAELEDDGGLGIGNGDYFGILHDDRWLTLLNLTSGSLYDIEAGEYSDYFYDCVIESITQFTTKDYVDALVNKKTSTYVISYQTVAPTQETFVANKYKRIDGTKIATWNNFYEYTNHNPFGNGDLNSQETSVQIVDSYFICTDDTVIVASVDYSLKNGDIIRVIETDVPDRWYYTGNISGADAVIVKSEKGTKLYRHIIDDDNELNQIEFISDSPTPITIEETYLYDLISIGAVSSFRVYDDANTTIHSCVQISFELDGNNDLIMKAYTSGHSIVDEDLGTYNNATDIVTPL